MPLYTQLPAEINSVDVIIAGGGTAACVVASRLSDADPNLSILVFEAGSNSYKDPTIETPFLFFSHLAPGSKTMSFHENLSVYGVKGLKIADLSIARRTSLLIPMQRPSY